MSLDFPFALNVIIFMTVATRVGFFLMVAPLMSGKYFPRKGKAAFILIIAFVMAQILPVEWGEDLFLRNLDMWKLATILLSETLLGLLIGLVVLALADIFYFAGFMIDRNMGFMMARIADPNTGTTVSMMSTVLAQMFWVVFFIFDCHLEIIRFVALSFQKIPPGRFILHEGMLDMCVELTSDVFIVGLKISMPVFAVIILMNIAMGLMARIGQDFPVLMLSFPLRIGTGLLITMQLFPIFVQFCRGTNVRIFETIMYLLNTGAG